MTNRERKLKQFFEIGSTEIYFFDQSIWLFGPKIRNAPKKKNEKNLWKSPNLPPFVRISLTRSNQWTCNRKSLHNERYLFKHPMMWETYLLRVIDWSVGWGVECRSSETGDPVTALYVTSAIWCIALIVDAYWAIGLLIVFKQDGYTSLTVDESWQSRELVSLVSESYDLSVRSSCWEYNPALCTVANEHITRWLNSALWL